jgi:hypothetical protein
VIDFFYDRAGRFPFLPAEKKEHKKGKEIFNIDTF